MSKANNGKKQGRKRMSFRTALSATGFFVAVVIVFFICFAFNIDLQSVGIALAIGVGVLVGVPLFIFASRENTDIKDENATCQPIMRKYWDGHSAETLVKEYWEWTEGEHSSYSRVHFGGDVVAELQEAKKYEEALKILDSLESLSMKSRERYDYETYRDRVRPELLEGIEKQKRQAEERARNKNLRKK